MNIVPQGMKHCHRCSNDRPLSDFNRNKYSSDGYYSICKICKHLPNHNREILPEGFKRCKKCKTVYPSEHFSRIYANKSDLQSWCKICCAKKLSSYKQVHRAEISQYNQDYRLEHLEEIKQRRHAYDHVHREVVRRQEQAYHKNHPEASATWSRNRHARKKSAPGKHTEQDIQSQYERQKGRCYWCKHKISSGKRARHVDHVVPLSRGGSNGPENLVITCQSCNSRKHNKLPHEWDGSGGHLM